MNIYQILFLFFFCITLPWLSHAQNFQPSPEQIEQFKALPPEQQRALAEKLGIDIDALVAQHAQPNLTGENQQNRPRSDEKTKQVIEERAAQGTEKLSLEEDEGKEATEEILELFGYDLFNSNPDVFTPAIDIPVPTDYVMGPGDTIVIQLYGKENNAYSLVINREGQIQFPEIGPVNLAGLRFSQAQQVINDIVAEQMIGVKSSITMGALRTIRVFVLGEAAYPGSYTVGSLSTMTNALFASGGITKVGSLRNVQLKRQGIIVTQLDLYDLLLKGDTSKDTRLLPGDVIFIPPIGKTAGVSGEVKRPGIYELKNEKSVYETIQLAGGLLPTAYMPASRIDRITENGERTLVNLDLSDKQGRSFPINDADVIQIFSVLDTLRDVVIVEGHVKRPGGFAWRPDLRISHIIDSVDELLPNPDIEIALIQREVYETRQIEIHLFDLQEALKKPNSPADPLLEKRDTIIIFDYETDRTTTLEEIIARLKTQARYLENEKTVTISGSVRFPGIYPLAKGMKAHQLVKLAGGLTENALGTIGEITRYDTDENLNQRAAHISINLYDTNMELVAADTLQVKQLPRWQKKETVEIFGEVEFPGTYAILPGETLTDVLGRAGGLTPQAYPEGAIFSREELRLLEEERLEDLKDQLESDIAAGSLKEDSVKNTVDESEAQKILDSLEGVKPLGRMVIDLPNILNKPGQYDFQLENGDVLNIPRFKPSVTVVGEVQYPTSHFFDEKLSPQDYINRSGGTNEKADKGRVYVVKANGSVFRPSGSAWFKSKSLGIEPGDTIVVPLDTDQVDSLKLWASITQIVYQAALGVAAVSSL